MKRQTQERLQEYEKVVEAVDHIITVIDREYRHILANQALLDYLGRPREQVIGHFVWEVWGMDLFHEIKDRLDKALSGSTVRLQRTYNYPQRGEREIEVFYFPIQVAAGIDRIACIVEDITDLKQAERDREKLLEALQASNEQLRALSNRLVEMQEDERRRLMHEIHTQISQSLSSLMAQFGGGQNRMPTPIEPLGDPAQLSPREQEVLHLLVQGQTNREIADQLAISVRTVERYRASIMDRLGLRNSTELIVYAVTHGFYGRRG